MVINLRWKQLLLCSLVIFCSNAEPALNKKLKYKTKFKNCPSQTAGKFAMKVLKKYEKTNSLFMVKQEIREKYLREKHFIKNYSIAYNPMRNEMSIDLSCPKPLMKVLLMDVEAEGELESILVEDGDLIDPTYVVLLRGEKKLRTSLPSLAINKKDLDQKNRVLITNVLSEFGSEHYSKVGEIIFDKEKTVTMILSLNKRPVSVFMGQENLVEKTKKLRRLINYALEKRKQPTIINLINLKKVVVKFAHRK